MPNEPLQPRLDKVPKTPQPNTSPESILSSLAKKIEGNRVNPDKSQQKTTLRETIDDAKALQGWETSKNEYTQEGIEGILRGARNELYGKMDLTELVDESQWRILQPGDDSLNEALTIIKTAKERPDATDQSKEFDFLEKVVAKFKGEKTSEEVQQPAQVEQAKIEEVQGELGKIAHADPQQPARETIDIHPSEFTPLKPVSFGKPANILSTNDGLPIAAVQADSEGAEFLKGLRGDAEVDSHLITGESLPTELKKFTIGDKNYEVFGLINDEIKNTRSLNPDTARREIIDVLGKESGTFVFFAKEISSQKPVAILVDTNRSADFKRVFLGILGEEQHERTYGTATRRSLLACDQFDDIGGNLIYIHLLKKLTEKGTSNFPRLYQYGRANLVYQKDKLLNFAEDQGLANKPSLFELATQGSTCFSVMDLIGYEDGFSRKNITNDMSRPILSRLAELGYFAPKPHPFFNKDTGEVKAIDLAGSEPITLTAIKESFKFIGEFYGLPKELYEGERFEQSLPDYLKSFVGNTRGRIKPEHLDIFEPIIGKEIGVASAETLPVKIEIPIEKSAETPKPTQPEEQRPQQTETLPLANVAAIETAVNQPTTQVSTPEELKPAEPMVEAPRPQPSQEITPAGIVNDALMEFGIKPGDGIAGYKHDALDTVEDRLRKTYAGGTSDQAAELGKDPNFEILYMVANQARADYETENSPGPIGFFTRQKSPLFKEKYPFLDWITQFRTKPH
ncbi:hypothetical protein C4559_03890 [Candidatus Microgenomates bacterium]|nr:MAG: hypothetical protein C4559_03890 [Candidatus Microgenomates bacterium]